MASVTSVAPHTVTLSDHHKRHRGGRHKQARSQCSAVGRPLPLSAHPAHSRDMTRSIGTDLRPRPRSGRYSASFLLTLFFFMQVINVLNFIETFWDLAQPQGSTTHRQHTGPKIEIIVETPPQLSRKNKYERCLYWVKFLVQQETHLPTFDSSRKFSSWYYANPLIIYPKRNVFYANTTKIVTNKLHAQYFDSWNIFSALRDVTRAHTEVCRGPECEYFLPRYFLAR